MGRVVHAGWSQIKWCPWLSGSRSSFARSLLFLTMESRVPPSSSPTMTASEMTLPTWIAMVGAVWAEGAPCAKAAQEAQ